MIQTRVVEAYKSAQSFEDALNEDLDVINKNCRFIDIKYNCNQPSDFGAIYYSALIIFDDEREKGAAK